MRNNLDQNLKEFISTTIGSKTADFGKISLKEDQLSDFRKACLEESGKELCSNSETSE